MKRSPREIFLCHKANWDLVRESTARISNRYFNLNCINERSVEENWKFFHKQYLQLIEEHVLKKTLSTKSHLPWMNTTLKRLLKKKQQTYNHAKKYQHKEDWNEYKNLKPYKGLMYHQQYLSNLIASNDSKRFWHYIKSKYQDNVGIGGIK